MGEKSIFNFIKELCSNRSVSININLGIPVQANTPESSSSAQEKKYENDIAPPKIRSDSPEIQKKQLTLPQQIPSKSCESTSNFPAKEFQNPPTKFLITKPAVHGSLIVSNGHLRLRILDPNCLPVDKVRISASLIKFLCEQRECLSNFK